jgi:hypothetical protein
MNDSASRAVDGELIAVDRDSIHVLTQRGYLSSFGAREVNSVTLTTFTQPPGMGTWLTVGTLSTASHGFYLVLTAPAWLIVGGMSVNQARLAGRVTDRAGIRSLRAYARFPQGMPAGLARSTLSPKPFDQNRPAPQR